jgi:SAM-dependent methyltransferase
VVCDVRALPFAEGCLGGVLSVSTLDHFEAAESIVDSLQELYRVLIPGGRLLLTLDNPWNPEVLLRTVLPSSLVSRLRADRFAWGKLLNTRQAESVFRQLGIRVKQRGYLIHAPRYLGIRVLNWLERRRWNAWTRRVVRLIEAFELLSRSPLRAFTGHYIAWWLEKP